MNTCKAAGSCVSMAAAHSAVATDVVTCCIVLAVTTSLCTVFTEVPKSAF